MFCVQAGDDIFVRPLAGHVVTEPIAWATNIVCLPLWLVNGWLPARYLTTWYHALVIVYLSLALSGTWSADWMSGMLWILCLYIPPSSLVVMVYARRLRQSLVAALTWPGFIVQQLVTHLLPSLLVWFLLPVPHPPPMVGTACFVAWICIYCVYLDVVMAESPTDNYFIDRSRSDHVLAWWSLFFLVSCAIGEIVFATT